MNTSVRTITHLKPFEVFSNRVKSIAKTSKVFFFTYKLPSNGLSTKDRCLNDHASFTFASDNPSYNIRYYSWPETCFRYQCHCSLTTLVSRLHIQRLHYLWSKTFWCSLLQILTVQALTGHVQHTIFQL